MTALERMEDAGILPVVPLEHTADAVPAAKALLAGGVRVMVLSYGTELADSIAAIADACPEMLVGAGMVLTLEQCQAAAASGAAFVTMPGYNAQAVAWCQEQQLCVIPGCATPTEIMAAVAQGVDTVGFVPAELYGGLRGLALLQAAFPQMRFLPAGGIESSSLAEYLCAPGVLAVCGDWLCPRELVVEAQFDQVTALAAQARKAVLGFEIAHIGINTVDDQASLAVCEELENAFGFGIKQGSSSNFAGSAVEVMKSMYLGKNGHLAIRTNNIPRAAAELRRHGYEMDESTAKFKNRMPLAIYLNREFGGFAVHLLQKS